MANRGLSARDRFLLIFLAVLVIGVCYYMFFYSPLQTELQNIELQCSEADAQIETSMAKLGTMDEMQAELDEIFSRPESEITEIAPYDNAKVVMSQLNGILDASENYSLSFKEPSIEPDGIVRREVQMSFVCKDYDSAKAIIEALARSRWRCLINGIAVSGAEEKADEEAPVVTDGTMAGAVTVQATITFFESTNLSS